MLATIESNALALRVATVASFDTGQVGLLRLRNFYPPEPDFAWTAGAWGEVEFDFDPGGAKRPHILELELDVFREPSLLEGQDVRVYFNGLRVGSRYVSRREVMAFTIQPSTLLPHGNVLVLDALDAARPSDFGHPDTRLLGVKLFSIALYAE